MNSFGNKCVFPWPLIPGGRCLDGAACGDGRRLGQPRHRHVRGRPRQPAVQVCGARRLGWAAAMICRGPSNDSTGAPCMKFGCVVIPGPLESNAVADNVAHHQDDATMLPRTPALVCYRACKPSRMQAVGHKSKRPSTHMHPMPAGLLRMAAWRSPRPTACWTQGSCRGDTTPSQRWAGVTGCAAASRAATWIAVPAGPEAFQVAQEQAWSIWFRRSLGEAGSRTAPAPVSWPSVADIGVLHLTACAARRGAAPRPPSLC
jgi:hypothetical protein